MAKITMMRLPNTKTREQWAPRISSAWREQLPSIFETGNLLEAAKAELQHGEWLKMINDDLPFDRTTARRLIAIATNNNLRNEAHVPHLPAVWSTLHELTKLTEKQFADGVKNGVINPKMKHKDVAALRGIEPKEQSKKTPTKKKQSESGRTLDDWWSFFSLEIHDASMTLSTDEKKELLDQIMQMVEELKS